MSYYIEGIDARWRGETPWRNPYRAHTFSHELWLRGWLEAHKGAQA